MTHHNTALSFLRKGYQVIPLNRKTGAPMIKFKDIPITEELITSINWFNCDYALLMRGIWCIDIDTHNMDDTLIGGLKILLKSCKADIFQILTTDHNNYGLDGYSSILNHEYRDELVENFNRTFLEMTASGGLHILFKKRPGVAYTQKIGVMDGVDIKANDNNFVKIFPSVGREVLQPVAELPMYEGKFEQEVFAPKERITTQYFAQNIAIPTGGSHEGREAYERVTTGSSMNRNDDLFKGACWAIENGHDLSDLEAIIGTIKGRDVFTREEFDRTIESAKRKVSYVTFNRA